MPHDKTPSPTFKVAETALFLDLDGAIVPIAAQPDEVRASPSCRIVLHRALDLLRGRLAVLSGRTIKAVDEVLGGAIHCVAGVHGLQRRTPVGGLVLEPPHARIADASEVLEALARARPGRTAPGPPLARASIVVSRARSTVVRVPPASIPR